ncbi:hypothetical protein HYO98_gp05 [Dinoroseobacter phage DS-1410Ws-06]|uniref:Uncharacterized protein n=1 Tax=Dinoroseobacter phage DS-1410Ws-06 TaxID=1815983 RepID=A0A191VY71_9CAUD|nr:hypothetical protein HYO98_gp05 [Dinoroseobacter phage DS-1410Ws-06]ANJ20662.1 hypothetical protein DSp06_gp05 [Dinoroseobacter phage DS-1410Ws-06]
MNATYTTWYIRADQAWDAYHEAEQAHADLCEGHLAEAEEMAVLQQEMKEWREAAEFAEKMMNQMEECRMVSDKVCAQPLFIPGTPEEIVRNEVFA